MLENNTLDIRQSWSFLRAIKQRDPNKIDILVQFLLIYRELAQSFVLIFVRKTMKTHINLRVSLQAERPLAI